MQEGKIYRYTDDEVSNELIDNYEKGYGYEQWANLDPAIKLQILEEDWNDQQLYELYCRYDLHE